MWDENIRYVHAENVTDRYVDLYKAYESTIKADGRHIPVKVMMFRTEQCMQIMRPDGCQCICFCWSGADGGRRTAGATQDMNDALEFYWRRIRLILLNIRMKKEEKS